MQMTNFFSSSLLQSSLYATETYNEHVVAYICPKTFQSSFDLL